MHARRTLGLVLLTSLTLVGVACGDDGGSSGGSAEEFCDVVASFSEMQGAGDEMFNGTEAPGADEVEAVFTDLGKAVDRLVAAAPSEIKDDVELMGETTSGLIDAFEKADWDFMALATDPAFVELADQMDSDEVGAAEERINDYTKAECGIDLDS